MASTARKESEQQTDITYGQSNKKIQVTNTLDDQNSDVDEDVETTSSVLSQSLRSTHSNGGGDPSRFVFFVCILFFLVTENHLVSWSYQIFSQWNDFYFPTFNWVVLSGYSTISHPSLECQITSETLFTNNVHCLVIFPILQYRGKKIFVYFLHLS